MKRHYIGKLLAGMTIAASMVTSAAMADDMRIALVVKALGIGFFEAAVWKSSIQARPIQQPRVRSR